MEWTEEKEQLYEQFHNRFSIEKIKSMSLNEYNNTERKDSFCYWIETKLRCLGSIQGATSYKFGIYKYNDSPREDIGYNHNDNYAWLSKYGNTAEEVYKVVHSNILKIAEAAQKGDFDSIEKIDISNMFKWKIAFLYSNQKFLNIFAEDGLRFLVKKYGMENFNKASFSEMYQFLIKLKKETNVFEFTSKLWNEWLNSDEYKSKNAKKIKFWSGGIKWGNNDKFQEFSKNDFWQIGWDETSDTKGAKQAWNNIKKIQIGDYFSFHGYGGKNDLTIYQISKVIDKDVENGKLFIEKLNKEEDVLFHDKAPKMDKGGWFGTLFEVTGKEAINSIFGKYIQGDNEMQNEFENQLNKYKTLLENNRNLILHGAPGTGKTHLAKDIAKAMGCTDNEIGFVQFHPSYDYTDFVEGLRPVEGDNGQVGFERKDGVFKEFCEKALKNLVDSRKSVEVQIADDFFDKVYSMLINDVEEGICNTYPTQKGEFAVSVLENENLIFEQNSPRKKNVKKDYLEILFNVIKDDNVLDVKNINREDLDKLVTENIKIINHVDYIQYRWALFQLVERYKQLKTTYISEITEKIPLKNFVFIIDEINRGEVAKIFGELFYSVDPGYRFTSDDLDAIKNGNKTVTTIKTQYANLETEGNEFDKALCATDYGHFFIPENVYIIGTMNDIDRSVESMDFAMRRRFSWVEVKTSDTVGMLYPFTNENGETTGLESKELADEAKRRMDNLNAAISEIAGLNEAYYIGASYFLNLKNYEGCQDVRFKNLWEYHLKGILTEYLRGNPNGKLEDLKVAYDREE